MDTIGLTNAAWWLPHSTVVLKGLYLAEDEAWVANNMVTVSGANTGNATVETHAGNQTMLKIQRMVKSGTVAVMLKGGATYEVALPQDAGKLLQSDLAYISSQIDAMSQPMGVEEQKAFLASANGHLKADLHRVK